MNKIILEYTTTIKGWNTKHGWRSIKNFLNSDFNKENIHSISWTFNNLKFHYDIKNEYHPQNISNIEEVLSMKYVQNIKKILDKVDLYDEQTKQPLNKEKIDIKLRINYVIWEE